MGWIFRISRFFSDFFSTFFKFSGEIFPGLKKRLVGLGEGGLDILLEACPVDFNFNWLAVDKSKNQLFNSPFSTTLSSLVVNPSPSNGLDWRPLFFNGLSVIFISEENIFLPSLFFKKLVFLAIELPLIELDKCFKKLFATRGENITGILFVFIFFGFNFSIFYKVYKYYFECSLHNCNKG